MAQTRDSEFYPQSLEKGLRSERALLLSIGEMYVQGVSTRRVKKSVEELCGMDVSSTPVSCAADELDELLSAWCERALWRCRYLVLKRWDALTRYLDDGEAPIDNNWIDTQVRLWAQGQKNSLFAGSQRSGERAANVMSVIQSAKIDGLDPQAYPRDVLERLPSMKC